MEYGFGTGFNHGDSVYIKLSQNAHERLTQLLEQISGRRDHVLTDYQIETIAFNVSQMMTPIKAV